MMKTELFRDLQSFNEERCVFEARLILSDRRRGVLVTPTMDEWVGIHIMERDDPIAIYNWLKENKGKVKL